MTLMERSELDQLIKKAREQFGQQLRQLGQILASLKLRRDKLSQAKKNPLLTFLLAAERAGKNRPPIRQPTLGRQKHEFSSTR